jgi:cyclophilin family peptidyl-prolyl cis-trans isomerase
MQERTAKFADENFINKHKVGALSMANSGKNTNGSQVFLCTAACTHLNGKHVVFGEVADDESMKIVKTVESYGSEDGTTQAVVHITESGATWGEFVPTQFAAE